MEKDNLLVTEAELAILAKEARQGLGLTQQEAAFRINAIYADPSKIKLSASQPAIAMAENNPEKPYISLRIAMIETFTKYRVEGPFYRLKK